MSSIVNYFIVSKHLHILINTVSNHIYYKCEIKLFQMQQKSPNIKAEIRKGNYWKNTELVSRGEKKISLETKTFLGNHRTQNQTLNDC